MTRISRRSTGVLTVLLAVILAAAASLHAPESSKAYSWFSMQYYLRNNHGTYNYSYRTTQFYWQNWNGYLVAVPQVSFSAAIPSTGWAYYGWHMGAYPSWFGGWVTRSSSSIEPGFSMDSNNGWVSRAQFSFGDLYVRPGGKGEGFTFLCENSNDCAVNTTAWYGAYVGGAMDYNATSGYFNGAGH